MVQEKKIHIEFYIAIVLAYMAIWLSIWTYYVCYGLEIINILYFSLIILVSSIVLLTFAYLQLKDIFDKKKEQLEKEYILIKKEQCEFEKKKNDYQAYINNIKKELLEEIYQTSKEREDNKKALTLKISEIEEKSKREVRQISIELQVQYESRQTQLLSDYQLKQTQLQSQYKSKQTQLLIDYEKLNRELCEMYNAKFLEREEQLLDLEEKIKERESKLNDLYNDRYKKIEEIIKSHYPLQRSAQLYSDVIALIKRDYSSDGIPQDISKVKDLVEQLRYAQYKQEYLISLFPDLEIILKNETALLSFDEFINRDNVYTYLTNEEKSEYKNSKDKKKWLDIALHRYKRQKKSEWVAGAEYEMYIEYILREKGFQTIPTGIYLLKRDLGRDIIATKKYKDRTIHYVIQCKRYAHDKDVSEKTVGQTFATARMYAIENKIAFENVIPVIYSTVPLSSIALDFAKKLQVQHRCVQMGEYPMVKCNINKNGEKIYHMPFDAQYWRTRIFKKGECYVYNSAEAEEKKFRRTK